MLDIPASAFSCILAISFVPMSRLLAGERSTCFMISWKFPSTAMRPTGFSTLEIRTETSFPEMMSTPNWQSHAFQYGFYNPKSSMAFHLLTRNFGHNNSRVDPSTRTLAAEMKRTWGFLKGILESWVRLVSSMSSTKDVELFCFFVLKRFHKNGQF